MILDNFVKKPQPDHGVYTVFIDLGNTKIELLHPLGEKSPIKAFLEKNANGGIHHICIEVKYSPFDLKFNQLLRYIISNR